MTQECWDAGNKQMLMWGGDVMDKSGRGSDHPKYKTLFCLVASSHADSCGLICPRFLTLPLPQCSRGEWN